MTQQEPTEKSDQAPPDPEMDRGGAAEEITPPEADLPREEQIPPVPSPLVETEADAEVDADASPMEAVEPLPAADSPAPEEEAESGEPALDAEEEELISVLPEGMDPVDLVEALIFSATEALSLDRLAGATGLEPKVVKEALVALGERLEDQNRPYRLTPMGRGWRLLTQPCFHPFIAQMKGIKKQEGLSKAALETLAIVAYRQPIMRAEIEDIRGVQCGPMLRALLERKLVKIAGRAQVPGRPLLYGTTSLFLDKFALADLKDLPTLREFKDERGG